MKTILYVEDNEANVNLVRRMLHRSPYELLVATSGVDGLDAATHRLPDLILMDINLPDISGVEAISRLKASPRLRHIPVVAFTADPSLSGRQRCLDAGCDHYLNKPVTPVALLQTIDHLVGVP